MDVGYYFIKVNQVQTLTGNMTGRLIPTTGGCASLEIWTLLDSSTEIICLTVALCRKEFDQWSKKELECFANF